METRRRNSPSSTSATARLEDTATAPGAAGYPEPDAGSRDQLIASRAYQRYEERGRDDGRDQEDWFEAERELLSDTPKE
jgi:hypothetical protein